MLLESANIYFKRIERAKELKSLMRFFCEAGFSGVGINLRPFTSKAISWSVRFVLDIFLMNFSVINSPKFVFVLISKGFAHSGSLLAYGLSSHGFGAGRVSEHTFEYDATLSFLFSRLEKAFTRVVSSLILAFKSLTSSALFCCLLARLF